MSAITKYAEEYGIHNIAEVEMLEHFFVNPEIQKTLEEAEKFRIRRYMLLIPGIILICIILSYLGSKGMVSVEIGDTGKYRPSDIYDGIWWSCIGSIVFLGFIVSLFHSKIEGAIKQQILSKLAKEIYSRLDYDSSSKYAFGDLGYLKEKGFLNSYQTIDKLEDSIGLTIEQDKKLLIAQGYELQTSEVRGSGKNRRRVTTNHCYLMKVKFPLARIPLEHTLYIRSDESDTLINGSLRFLFIGGLIGFFIGLFISSLFHTSFIIPLAIIIGALIGYMLRKRHRNENRVVLENTDFEKLYDVECSDQIGSRMIITPAFMDRLVYFAQKSKHKFEFIYEADCFYIKWNLSGSYLEVNTWKKITKNIATYIHWYSQMKEILSFIFDMRLLYFSKTNPDISISPESLGYQRMPESLTEGLGKNNWMTSIISGIGLSNMAGR